jgi:hypothetical protein
MAIAPLRFVTLLPSHPVSSRLTDVMGPRSPPPVKPASINDFED